MGPSGKHDASATRFMITHDFVHKTHLRIFDTYYPPVLSDWWMDDWISHVYPSTNANKVASSLLPCRFFCPWRCQASRPRPSRDEDEIAQDG